MQDPSSGELVKGGTTTFEQLHGRLKSEGRDPLMLSFRVGEVVQIKKARFRVAAIGRRFMRLESVPETTNVG